MLYKNLIKPSIDIFAAALAIIILSPVMLVLGILLAINLKGTPFFTQERNGKKGKVFKVIKFRTMSNKRDSEGKLLPNNQRLTKFGGMVRKTSLDELPQFLNVLKGDMSFIGPRPLPTHYYPYFEGEELKRFWVKPGISGLAQISGRNLLNWDKRIAKDIEYVENLSLLLDLKILWGTIIKVIKKDNLVVDPTSVMMDFDVYKKMKNNG